MEALEAFVLDVDLLLTGDDDDSLDEDAIVLREDEVLLPLLLPPALGIVVLPPALAAIEAVRLANDPPLLLLVVNDDSRLVSSSFVDEIAAVVGCTSESLLHHRADPVSADDSDVDKIRSDVVPVVLTVRLRRKDDGDDRGDLSSTPNASATTVAWKRNSDNIQKTLINIVTHSRRS